MTILHLEVAYSVTLQVWPSDPVCDSALAHKPTYAGSSQPPLCCGTLCFFITPESLCNSSVRLEGGGEWADSHRKVDVSPVAFGETVKEWAKLLPWFPVGLGF